MSYAALKILLAARDRELEANGYGPQVQRLNSQIAAHERELRLKACGCHACQVGLADA